MTFRAASAAAAAAAATATATATAYLSPRVTIVCIDIHTRAAEHSDYVEDF